MTTLGDLALNDIGKTRISLDYKGDTIAGIIHDIRTETDTLRHDIMIGTRVYRRGDRFTRVKITFTNFIVSDLPLDHPCEVIA